jgi:hypothetical protein
LQGYEIVAIHVYQGNCFLLHIWRMILGRQQRLL